MITIPSWLFVSQWVLLFAFAFLLFTVYRQMGFWLGLKQQGTNKEGLAIGARAPGFSFDTINPPADASPVRFEPQGSWSFLLFAHPSCVGCQQALPIIERLIAESTNKTLQTLVATTSDLAFIEASEVFGRTSLPIGRVSSDVSLKLYLTRSMPFAYVIDPEGTIRAKGIISGESAVRKLFSSSDHNKVIPVESVLR